MGLEGIKTALAELQLAYREYGYVTVGVSLPRQKLPNGIVRVLVTEGKLAAVNVVGNRFYSSANVRRALPDVTTYVLLNIKWFQPELDRANANGDRQIYPVIAPGPEPDTSALTLQVKDRLPLHGHVELDNKSTPGTPALPPWRPGRVQYTITSGRLDHQIGFQSSLSPEEYTVRPARLL